MSDTSKELNLNTEINESRPKVVIDGSAYYMRTMDDMKYRNAMWYPWASKRINELLEELQEDYTEDKADELESILDKAANMILMDVPDEVYQKLSDSQKMEIVRFFTEAVNTEGASDSRDANGGTLSQGSKATTEGAQANGLISKSGS